MEIQSLQEKIKEYEDERGELQTKLNNLESQGKMEKMEIEKDQNTKRQIDEERRELLLQREQL